MPCRTYGDIDPHSNTEYLDRINELEAAVCALCNELEDMGYLDEVIKSAEKNGVTNIREIWKEHQHRDLVRMEKKLATFSEHEIKLIRKILG